MSERNNCSTEHGDAAKPFGAAQSRPSNGHADVRDWREIPRRRFTCHYPEDFKHEPISWLVQKIVPESALGVVFAPSGAGKTTMLVAMCCEAATGGTFLGRRCKPCGIIYVGCEDPKGVMYRREAWIAKNRADRSSMPFAIIPEPPDLWASSNADDADIDVLIEQIKAERFVLKERGAEMFIVVLDTSRKAFPGMKENDSADVDRMCRLARRIIAECRATVIFASHVAVAGNGEDPRGSGGFIGDADFALGLKKHEGGGGEVWVRKMRNGKDADSDPTLRWTYSLTPVALGFDGEDGNPETVAVFHATGEAPPPSKTKGRRAPPAGARTVLKAINDLLSEGQGETPPTCAQFPTGMRAVRVAHALDRARANGISRASCKDPMEASRKAFERGKQFWLESHGLIERDGWIAPPPRK